MNKTSKILSVLLAAQVGVFLFLQMRSQEPLATFNKTEPLVQIPFDKVGKMVIEDGDKKTVTLLKKDGAWQLPDQFGFPVAEAKIQEFADKLKEFKKSWPAGKTMISAKQFKVTADQFERKIQFFIEDKVVSTLYIGTSPGFRQVYARVNEEVQTFTLAFNAHDLPIKSSEWLDKKFSKLSVDNVEGARFSGLAVLKKEGALSLEGMPAGKVVDQGKLKTFLENASTPNFEDVVAKPAKLDLAFQYTLQVKGEEKPLTYAFYTEPAPAPAKPSGKKGEEAKSEAAKSPDTYYLEISKYPAYTLQMKSPQVKELQEAKVDTYVMDPPKAEEKAAAKPEEKKEGA